jgi:uncharacterized protein
VLKILLIFLLAMFVARAFWRLIGGIIAGASPPPPRRGGVPDRGVQMVRDPVCGTFLLPADALTATERGGAVRYFCSETCRRRYREKIPSGRA